MARPKNKKELLTQSGENYKKLIDLINSYSETELQTQFPKGFLNRNVRDVLAHLHHWHLMMSDWYEVGMSGDKPYIPAKGYTWKTTPDLNRAIWGMYTQVPIEEVKELLENSHQQLQKLIEKHSDLELFEKKKYSWTGSTSLGAYFISAISSHYDWALKLIKKCMKASSLSG